MFGIVIVMPFCAIANSLLLTVTQVQERHGYSTGCVVLFETAIKVFPCPINGSSSLSSGPGGILLR